MAACFGLGGDPLDLRAPSTRLVEAHPVLDVFQLAREGLLTPGAEGRIEGGDGHAPYQLAVHQVGILEIDGQSIRVAPHCALPLRLFVCPCGRDCYRLHQVGGRWACRRCHQLSYASRHRHRSIPSYNRMICLRRRLAAYGVSPVLFSPVEPRPLSHRRFWRLLLELRSIEAALVLHLREDVADVLERRDGRRRSRSRVDPS